MAVNVVRLADGPSLARAVAARVASLVQARHAAGPGAVLALPTGATPLPLYRELVRMHREDGLDFSKVKVFNLDEYLGVAPTDEAGFQAQLRRHLVDALDHPTRGLRPQNVQLLRGDVTPEEADEVCRAYEQRLREAGGLDLVLLGIGPNGHIAFNEPGAGVTTRTRLVVLAEDTRRRAARAFGGELERTPTHALTLGVATLLEARAVALLASGPEKADIIRRALLEEAGPHLPASQLQHHPEATFYLCDGADGGLPSSPC